MSDAGVTEDPTETPEMDCSNPPQTRRQHYTASYNPEARGEKETHGTAIWKQTAKKLVTPGDSWRNWLKTGVHDVVMMAAYAQVGATKAVID